jgi:hypothetical protein
MPRTASHEAPPPGVRGLISPSYPPPCGGLNLGLCPFPVPRPLFPIPDVAFSQQVIHNGVCPCVHVKFRQIRVKIDQNGVKFGSKRHQKRAQIVMPILTFWGVTPSGASARAVFAFRKGKKTGFRGTKWRAQKLSTIGKNFKSGNGEPPAAGRPWNRERGTRLRCGCGGQARQPATGNGERQAQVPDCELRIALRYKSCETLGML